MLNANVGLKRLTTALVAFLILAFTGMVYGQEGTASLRGTVIDPQGAAVPNAQVSIANAETGLNRRTVNTTEGGDYVFTSLTPGIYRVTVEATGFKTAVKEKVKLNVGETQEFKVSLEVGGAQETVTVTTEESLVQTTSKVIGGHVS